MIYLNSSNSVILKTLGVPIINDFNHLAEQLSLSTGLLYFLTYQKKYCYTRKEIPKKDGTTRILYIPRLDLKVVQRWILKEILEKINVSQQAMAFVPKINGLKRNAEYHKNNIFILQMDLKNFFDSIREDRIFHLFCNIGYNKDVSAILTNLCTYNKKLPQGAVTSPYLANLSTYHLDARLSGLCSRKDIVYTRYADDLCFSSNDRTKLNRIEKFVRYIIKDEGLNLNKRKTRYLSNDVKKTVTGITINNEEIHADKHFKRKIRAMIFNSIMNQNNLENEKIRGSIAFVNSIEPGFKNKMVDYIKMLTDKPHLKNNKDIVLYFNQNKIYKSLPDMEYEEYMFPFD